MCLVTAFLLGAYRLNNFLFARQNEAARAADAAACIDASVRTVLLRTDSPGDRMNADGCQNCFIVKINEIVLPKVPVWQGFSGRNRLNSIAPASAAHPRAACF
jgi:hypothetical protein